MIPPLKSAKLLVSFTWYHHLVSCLWLICCCTKIIFVHGRRWWYWWWFVMKSPSQSLQQHSTHVIYLASLPSAIYRTLQYAISHIHTILWMEDTYIFLDSGANENRILPRHTKDAVVVVVGRSRKKTIHKPVSYFQSQRNNQGTTKHHHHYRSSDLTVVVVAIHDDSGDDFDDDFFCR